jgi:hypothetical protein
MDTCFVSLGYDCSPATVLKSLGYRKYSLPLDWVETKGNTLYNVLIDDFSNYHNRIKMSSDKKRIIDQYGVEFPHDYPTINKLNTEENILVDDWKKYTPDIQEKYKRRIERFRNIFLNSNNNVIVLFRGHSFYANKLKDILNMRYPQTNIFFVIATFETFYVRVLDNKIVMCNPEKNGVWNDVNAWNEAIETAKRLIVENHC